MNNKTSYYLRIVVALYIIYLAYGIIRGQIVGDAGTTPWMLIPAILFVVCGVFFLVTSVKALNRISKEEQAEAEKASEEEAQEVQEELEAAPAKSLSISERARLVQPEAESEGEESES